ncbi:hypothetical protein MTO96_015374 [Rhipicephalus appendiculatus]
MALYGINANGRSESVYLTVFTLPLGKKLVSKADAELSLGSTTLWAAALSAVAAFLFVFIALTLGKFRRKILFSRGLVNGCCCAIENLRENRTDGTDSGAAIVARLLRTLIFERSVVAGQVTIGECGTRNSENREDTWDGDSSEELFRVSQGKCRLLMEQEKSEWLLRKLLPRDGQM